MHMKIIFLVLLFLNVASQCSAQRTAASLGTKLKKGQSQDRSFRKNEDAFAVEGEKLSIQDKFLEMVHEDPQKFVTAVAVVLVTILLFLNPFSRRKSASEEDEVVDDIVIQDDHIMAMGGLETVDLSFRNLYMELDTGKKKKDGNGKRVLLDGSIRGRAQPGRMLAIMGPSGAGKSTVLHALAGRIRESSKIALYGERFINGAQISGDSMVPSAFIEQEVNFFPYMTVRETLSFRVELKLGSLLSRKSRDSMVNDLLKQLRLENAADTIVGDAKVRGISGGERRRLSIACELISSPSMIFLDEPTSGLDSTAATFLTETLRSLADAGKTIVAVIHQPSQHVFAAFDDLLLVSEGKQMYFGEVSKVRKYMENLGYEAAAEMGTSEHILDCITKAPFTGETDEDVDARIERLAEAAKSTTINLDTTTTGKHVQRFGGVKGGGPRASILIQFKLLLHRALRENFRGKTKLIIQTVQQISMGLVYGGIYSIGTNQASIQDRFGVLSLIAIGSFNMAMASTVRTFPKEKAIISNEIASKMYQTLPYFIGKAISEVPLTFFFNSLFGVLVSSLTGLNGSMKKLRRFLGLNSLHGLAAQSAGLLLGSISPSSDAALAIFPAVMVLNIVFDGKNVSEENTPRFLRWLPKLGLIRWGFEGLCVNEFDGLEFDTGGARRGPVAKTGMDALARFGMGERSVSDVVRAQLNITFFCWLFSYIGLTLTRQKWQVMQDPKVTQS